MERQPPSPCPPPDPGPCACILRAWSAAMENSAAALVSSDFKGSDVLDDDDDGGASPPVVVLALPPPPPPMVMVLLLLPVSRTAVGRDGKGLDEHHVRVSNI